MAYGIITDGIYIFGVVKNAKESTVTKEEYETILALLLSRPDAPDGYVYKLRLDNYEWELAEREPDPIIDEPTADEALSILLGGAE